MENNNAWLCITVSYMAVYTYGLYAVSFPCSILKITAFIAIEAFSTGIATGTIASTNMHTVGNAFVEYLNK